MPVVPELASMLKERKEYLLRKGISEKDLLNMPIILENEKRKRRFCRPQIAAKTCREIISAAGIAPNIVKLPDEKQGTINTDLNAYYGDIFRSNFRYRATHTAYMDKGETNYVLAIEAPDTYSEHYLDFVNDFVQLGIANKLHRWAERHFSADIDYRFFTQECESKKACYECTHEPKSGVIQLDEVIKIIPDDTEEYIDVIISTRHGITGNIDFVKGR